MQETLIIDGHVHIYPELDLSLMIKNTLKNAIIAQRTSSNRDDALKVWILTERSDCSVFADLKNGREVKDFTVHPTDEAESLLIKDGGTKEPVLYIVAGRQLVARENIEICSIATLCSVDDRQLPANELIEKVLEEGGIPAVNWAPGKWFGERGEVVKNLFQAFSPSQLLVSDTTMRPSVWPTPAIMKGAIKKGYKVIAGSDPLPFAGEENLVATYASIVSGEFDYDKPAGSVKKMLLDEAAKIVPCGRRSSFFTWVGRQKRIMKKNG